MKIQTKLTGTIKHPEKLTTEINEQVKSDLQRFEAHLTRVEIHITEETVHKSPANEYRCVIESRHVGLKPFVVKNQAATIYDSVNGAVDKLTKTIDHTRGKLNDLKRHKADGGITDEEPEELEDLEGEEVGV